MKSMPPNLGVLAYVAPVGVREGSGPFKGIPEVLEEAAGGIY